MNNFNNNININKLSTLCNKSNREYRNINKKIDEALNEYEKLQRKLKYNTNYINNNNININNFNNYNNNNIDNIDNFMKINVNNDINKQNKINLYNLKNNNNNNKINNEINNMNYNKDQLKNKYENEHLLKLENLALIKSNKELKNYNICLNLELKFYKNLTSNKINNIDNKILLNKFIDSLKTSLNTSEIHKIELNELLNQINNEKDYYEQEKKIVLN